MNNPLNMDTVYLSRIEKLVDVIKRQNKTKPIPDIDPDITFEYVIGSLFPKAYQNMKDTMTQYYIQGYNKAKEELEEKHED